MFSSGDTKQRRFVGKNGSRTWLPFLLLRAFWVAVCKRRFHRDFVGDRKLSIKHKIPRSYSAAEENAPSFTDLGMTSLGRIAKMTSPGRIAKERHLRYLSARFFPPEEPGVVCLTGDQIHRSFDCVPINFKKEKCAQALRSR